VTDSPASFHAAARWQGRCAVCLTDKEPWHAHHVLAKQYCRRENAPLHHPDDALRLCSMGPTSCHWRHEQWQERVPLTCLTDANIAFVILALGPGPGYNYLTRNYAGTDLRLEHILDCA
jgi:hypothetical protein